MDNHSIIRQFQNLRVFQNTKFVSMDELVHDLTQALEESAQPSTSRHQVAKRQLKKRKGKKRRTLVEGGHVSEASESSIDEAMRDYLESITQMSDSDDLTLSHQVARLSLPPDLNFVQSVESDSVNENFSPIREYRPQRRRKKYKQMAVDMDPDSESRGEFLLPDLSFKPKYKTQVSTGSLRSSAQGESMSSNGEGVYPGKRKRSSKSSSKTDTAGATASGKMSEDTMDTVIQESSSSLSSSESDGLLTNDESREADDEQSDFYFESGPACGIPGIIKWWENDPQEGSTDSDRQFQQILNGSFEHLPRSSQLAFRARVTKMLAKTGRQIRFGRRKLKAKEPGYTVSRYLEDQQMWSSMQGVHPSGRHGAGSNGNNYPKRHKKTPPPPPAFLCDQADPIPESNIGNKMLQNMGWTPGSGLGPDGGGIKTPVMAHRRQKRQGLGCSSHPYNRSLNDSG